MKKLIVYTLLVIATAASAFAQKDAEAKTILNAVSQKYHTYNTIKCDFTFVIDNPQAGETQTQNGTLIVQAKTNKYKLTLYGDGPRATAPVEQEIINDGKSQWTYLKKDKEVQLNNTDNSDAGFNPAKMFTMYEKGYKYLYAGNGSVKGKIYQVIDLTPEDIDKTYFKIRLTIDKVKKQIYSALIFDKNGMKYTYTIGTFTPDVQVPASTFTFDAKAHPGVEVVDLR